jgi:hypothetical protein
MLIVQYNILPNKKSLEEFSFRSFNKADIDDINKTASLIDWNVLYRNYNVDEKTQYFISTISNLFDNKIPLQNIKLKNAPVPWMNNDILNAMNCRNKFYKMFKINEQQSFKEIAYKCYKDSNKIVKKMINNAKKEHFEQSYYNSSDNKGRWRLIHSLGITKKSRKTFNNNSVSNITAESLHQYFLRNNIAESTSNVITMPKCNSVFSLNDIDEGDIINTVHNIKSNAAGSDGIPLKFYKMILGNILSPLVNIINFSFQSGIYPDCIKNIIVDPTPICNNPSKEEDFRPICRINVISKIFSNIS